MPHQPNKRAQELFIQGLSGSGQPEPQDLQKEMAVLAAALASEAACRTVVVYLEPTDFFDKEHRKTFGEIQQGFQDGAGQVDGEINPKVKAQCVALRRVTAARVARRLAWELVLSAHTRQPTEWCKIAEERVKGMIEWLKKSGL